MSKKVKLTPAQELDNLTRQLMESATMLVVKVAICKCKSKDNCAVYEKAREIASLIDQLTELRKKYPEVMQPRVEAAA